jgi:hypothetical protein
LNTGHIYALKPDIDVVVKLIEVARLDENVITNEDLLLSIHDDYEEPPIVGASLLAIGIRRLRDAFEQCQTLLSSKHQIVRLNAAIAVLHLNPSKEDRDTVREILEAELSLTNEPKARAMCLQQLSAALYQKVKVETENMNPTAARTQPIDGSKMVRPRSRQIKRLGLDYILPLTAQSLTVLSTANAAADVLDKFDSKEVQHLFNRLLRADEGGQFFVQPVFDYLAINSKRRVVALLCKLCSTRRTVFTRPCVVRTYSNKIVDTLLDLTLLQRPDMLGSKMATMVFRCVTTPLPHSAVYD